MSELDRVTVLIADGLTWVLTVQLPLVLHNQLTEHRLGDLVETIVSTFLRTFLSIARAIVFAFLIGGLFFVV